MSDFGTELARLMAARGLGVRELARMVPCNPEAYQEACGDPGRRALS